MARIILLGATGYTGRRTARALVARGASPVLAGRDSSRLTALAVELAGERAGALAGERALETVQVDVTDARSVRRLVEPDDVLVTTVGPFRRLGGAAAAAAVDAGATYLDSTGEGPFIREVFERHGPRAERTGAALLTAFGSDWVPGNLAGALALHAAAARPGARPATALHVGYFMTGADRGSLSRGTATSALGVMLEPSYTWRAGRLAEERGAARLRRFEVDEQVRPAMSTGGTEQLTLPRTFPALTDVDVYLGWLGRASVAVHRLSPVTAGLARVPGIRPALARIGGMLVRRLPEGPSLAAGAGVRSHVVAEASDAAGTVLARSRLDGPEAYAMTADLLAWGAVRAAEHGVDGTGALGPVGAFGVRALLDGAASAGLTARVQRAG